MHTLFCCGVAESLLAFFLQERLRKMYTSVASHSSYFLSALSAQIYNLNSTLIALSQSHVPNLTIIVRFLKVLTRSKATKQYLNMFHLFEKRREKHIYIRVFGRNSKFIHSVLKLAENHTNCHATILIKETNPIYSRLLTLN